MRSITSFVLATALFAMPGSGAESNRAGDKPGKAGKRVAAFPASFQGIRTPGIQIPFSLIAAEATIPAPNKPGWIFFLPDTPGGAGGGRGTRGGGDRAGRGAGSGPNPSRGTPAAESGTVFIPASEKLERVETKGSKIGEPLAGLKQPCGGMVSAFGSLWIPTCGDGALQRVDPKTSKVTATLGSGAADITGSIAASSDSIWLLTDNKETLSRIDPDQNAVVGEIRLPGGCRSLLFAENFLWLACPEQGKVLKINAATNVVEKRVEVSGRPLSLASGEGSVWAYCGKEGKVDRIDPKTDKVSKSIELLTPGADGALAYGEGFLWLTVTGFPITRIDTAAETVAQQFRGEGGGAIAIGAGSLWLSNRDAGTVTQLDPKLLRATLAE